MKTDFEINTGAKSVISVLSEAHEIESTILNLINKRNCSTITNCQWFSPYVVLSRDLLALIQSKKFPCYEKCLQESESAHISKATTCTKAMSHAALTTLLLAQPRLPPSKLSSLFSWTLPWHCIKVENNSSINRVFSTSKHECQFGNFLLPTDCFWKLLNPIQKCQSPSTAEEIESSGKQNYLAAASYSLTLQAKITIVGLSWKDIHWALLQKYIDYVMFGWLPWLCKIWM